MQSSSNVNMLHDMTRHLSLHLPKLTRDRDLLQPAFILVLHVHKTCPDKKHVRLALSIARKMGVDCLKQFVGRWRGVLSCEQLRELITLFRPTPSEAVPRVMAQLIQQYLRAFEMHSDRAIELLKVLQSVDRQYEQARCTIMKQPQYFHASTLFELAIMEERRGGVLTTQTLAIVVSGLQQAEPTRAFVKWLVDCCRRDGMMARLVDIVSKHVHISVLLAMLENRRANRDKHSKRLDTALLSAYLQRFTSSCQQLHTYEECRCEVRELCLARDHCHRYIRPNGRQRFEKVVLQLVEDKYVQNHKFMMVYKQSFS